MKQNLELYFYYNDAINFYNLITETMYESKKDMTLQKQFILTERTREKS